MHPALQDELLAEADAVGLRLRSCINEILALDPTHSQTSPATAKSIATLLNIDAVIAKRLVKMCRTDLSPKDVCTNAPSPANLRLALQAALKAQTTRAIDPLIQWGIEDAIKKFERLIESAAGPAGPKATLTKLLRDNPGDPNANANNNADNNDHNTKPSLPGILSLTDTNIINTEDNTTIANIFEGNILNDTDMPIARSLLAQPPHAIITRTGTLAESLGELDLNTWTDKGTHALTRTLNDLLAANPNANIYLMPANRDVLSDVQRTKSFFKSLPPTHTPRVHLALAPAHLIDPDSPTDNRDHLRRTTDTLAPLAALIILHDPSTTPGAPSAEQLTPFLQALPPNTPIATPHPTPNSAFSDTIIKQLTQA